MSQFTSFKIINRIIYIIKIIVLLLWCNQSYAFELSDITDIFKPKNNPPTELFGIKLLANINDYVDYKITFSKLDYVYEDFDIPFFYTTKSLTATDIVTIKNPNFDEYTLYINDNLQITGITADNWNNPIKDDVNLKKCLFIKKQLVTKIANLHNLNLNKFKDQNYITIPDDPDYEYMKNDIASSSEFKFDQNRIKFIYSLSCYYNAEDRSSILFIELSKEDLYDALWGAYMIKSEKSVEQLLNSDMKGF